MNPIERKKQRRADLRAWLKRGGEIITVRRPAILRSRRVETKGRTP